MALSVWATTMLSLYTKVQVNILGRHLYIDTARTLGSSSAMVRTTVFLLLFSFPFFFSFFPFFFSFFFSFFLSVDFFISLAVEYNWDTLDI